MLPLNYWKCDIIHDTRIILPSKKLKKREFWNFICPKELQIRDCRHAVCQFCVSCNSNTHKKIRNVTGHAIWLFLLSWISERKMQQPKADARPPVQNTLGDCDAYSAKISPSSTSLLQKMWPRIHLGTKEIDSKISLKRELLVCWIFILPHSWRTGGVLTLHLSPNEGCLQEEPWENLTHEHL